MSKYLWIVGIALVFCYPSLESAGQSPSSNLSSSSLTSTPSSGSALRGSTTPQLEWLNHRLSETRSTRIRSKLGLDRRGPKEKPKKSSYLLRREALSHRARTTTPESDRLDTLKSGKILTDYPRSRPSSEEPPVLESSSLSASKPSTPRETPTREGLRSRRDENTNSSEALSETVSSLPSQAGLKSLPLFEEGEPLLSSRPSSSRTGQVQEEERTGMDREDLLAGEEEPMEEEVAEEREEPVEVEERKAPVEEILRSRLIPSRVTPAVPTPPPNPYQLQSQKMWSQVPVRQPRTSQFGPGVAPGSIPFERSSLKTPGVYSGFQRPRVGGRTDSSYQYRGPRLYSIGESEYDYNTNYQSLPYYRR